MVHWIITVHLKCTVALTRMFFFLEFLFFCGIQCIVDSSAAHPQCRTNLDVFLVLIQCNCSEHPKCSVGLTWCFYLIFIFYFILIFYFVQCNLVVTWMGFDWIEWKKPLVHSATLPPSQIGLCCHLCHNLRLDFQCNTEAMLLTLCNWDLATV